METKLKETISKPIKAIKQGNILAPTKLSFSIGNKTQLECNEIKEKVGGDKNK